MNQPKIDESAVVLKGAVLVGDVTLCKNASVFYNSVLRGDVGAIRIGANSNIQDNCTLHCDHGESLSVGSNVTVGHGTILHGCVIEDEVFVGMGCLVMNGAVLEKGCMLGAGAMVTGGAVIPAGMLAFGRPAKPVRPLTEEEMATNVGHAKEYVRMAAALGNEQEK